MGQYFLALSQDPETRPGAAEASSPGGEKRRSGGGGQIQRKVSCERWDRRYCADATLAKKKVSATILPRGKGEKRILQPMPFARFRRRSYRRNSPIHGEHLWNDQPEGFFQLAVGENRVSFSSSNVFLRNV